MSDSNQNAEFFDLLAKMLLQCWVFGFALLFVWVGMILLAGDAIDRLHGYLFGLSNHELNVILYCVLALFFFPWLAIRLVLRGGKA